MQAGQPGQPGQPGRPGTGPQRRWVHVVGALAAAVLVIGLLVVLQRTTGGPERARGGDTTPVPTPSPPPTASATPTAVPTAPTGPALPSITVPSLPTCPDPTAAAPIRVVSFNIHGGRSHTTYDLGRVVEEIRALDADVVLLQEVHRFKRISGFDDQPALLADRLGMTPVFGVTYTRAPEGPGQPRRESGNLILSRLPVLGSGNQALPNQPGLEPRALLHVDVEVGDQQVRVYDTHLQHTRGNIRIVQARAIRGLVAAAPGPFVLGGDLNATADSKALAVVQSFAVDSWPAVGTTEGLTVPARAPRRRIDYVLSGGAAWVPRQAQTFLSAVSDHRAVVTDLDLPYADPCAAP